MHSFSKKELGCGVPRVDRFNELPGKLSIHVYANHLPPHFHVVIGDEGNAIIWCDGQIDMPATAVERLAADRMSAENMREFMRSTRLTRDGLAAQLGVSRRLVGYWLEGQAIPRYIMLAWCVGRRSLRSVITDVRRRMQTARDISRS